MNVLIRLSACLTPRVLHRRAVLGDSSRFQASEAAVAPLRRGEAQDPWRGNPQAFDGRIHQGGSPSRLVSKSCTS